MRDRNCTRCELHLGARNVCIDGEGEENPALLIVGQNPGALENREDRPFIGPSGQIIRKILARVDVGWRLTNAVRCFTAANRQPTLLEATACRPYLIEEILETRPLVVLTLGDTALKTLSGTSGVGKNRGKPIAWRATLRDQLKGLSQEPILLTGWHPAFVLREPARLADLEADVAGAVRLIREIRGEEQGQRVEWTEHKWLAMHSPIWSFDIETNAKSYRDPDFKIHMLAVDDGTGPVLVESRPEQIAALRNAMALHESEYHGFNVGHNAIQFDCPGLSAIDDSPAVIFAEDTLLLAYLADESADHHDLQSTAVRYLNIPPWKDKVTWDWATYDPDKYFQDAAQYNARDTHYTRDLFLYFGANLSTKQINLYRHLLKPAARLLQTVHANGVPISEENLQRVTEEVERATELARDAIRIKAEEYGFDDFNPNSHPQMRKLLFDKLELKPQKFTDGGEPSTDEETLNALRLVCEDPLLGSIADYRKNNKLGSTYLRPYRLYLDGGRVHPSYSLTDTVSGRTSCYKPNFQNLPRDSRLRSIVRAGEGKVLVVADLSQIELRTMAFLSRDENMLRVYRENLYGGDMHAFMAEKIAKLRGRTEWTSEDRSLAKPVNFGTLYGAEAPTLQAYLLTKYGIRVSMSEAFSLREAFYGVFPGLPEYYMRVYAELKATLKVTSPLGRERRLENINAADQGLRAAAFREGINTPNQGLASDIMLIGAFLWDAAPKKSDAILCALIHDAGIWEVSEAQAQECVVEVRIALEQAPPRYLQDRFDIDFDVPIKADIAIMKEWEKT